MLRDYIALFGAGVASFLAPCLVPLVPAYLGIIVGESIDAHDMAKAVPATLVFILGFATVFASFGVAAGLVGRSLSPVQIVVQRVGGAVIILFGLALLGLVRGRWRGNAAWSRGCRSCVVRPARSWWASRSARHGAPASARCSARRW